MTQGAELFQKTKKLGQWQDRLQVTLLQDKVDADAGHEWRSKSEEVSLLVEENDSLRSIIVRAEERQKQLRDELESQRKVHETILVEARMSDSAACFSQKSGSGNLQRQRAEVQQLEDQLLVVRASMRSQSKSVNNFSQNEAVVADMQSILSSLSGCMREAQQLLKEPLVANGSPKSQELDLQMRTASPQGYRVQWGVPTLTAPTGLQGRLGPAVAV